MWISVFTKDGQRATINTDNVLYVLGYSDKIRMFFTKGYFKSMPVHQVDYIDVDMSMNEFNELVKGEK